MTEPATFTTIARLVDRATPAIQHRLDLLDELTVPHRDDILGVEAWTPDQVFEAVSRGGSYHYSALTRQTWGTHTRGGYAVGGTHPPLFIVVPERNYADLRRTEHAWRVVVFGFARYSATSPDPDLLALTGRWHLYGTFRLDSDWHDTSLIPDPASGTGAAAAARRLAWHVAQQLSEATQAFAESRWG